MSLSHRFRNVAQRIRSAGFTGAKFASAYSDTPQGRALLAKHSEKITQRFPGVVGRMAGFPGLETLVALFLVFRDPEVPYAAKAVAATALMYVVGPGMLTNAVPLIGWLDEAGAVAAARFALRAYLTPEVYADAREWLGKTARAAPTGHLSGKRGAQYGALRLGVRTIEAHLDAPPGGGVAWHPKESTRRSQAPAAFEEAHAFVSTMLKALTGMELSGELAHGDYGSIYKGEPFVVKVTGDQREAANAATVLRYYPEGLPGVVRFFGVFAIEGVKPYFVIFQEVLEPLNRSELAWVDRHRLDWQFILYTREHPSMPLATYTRLTARAHQEIGIHAHNREAVPKMLLHTRSYNLTTALHALAQIGVVVHDGHSNNVMARVNDVGERELVFLDLGYAPNPLARIPEWRGASTAR